MRLQLTRTSAAILTLSIVSSGGLAAQPAETHDSGSAAVEQLRHAVGQWNVVTEFLRPDGSVARSSEATYEFEWVLEDRVLSGSTREATSSQASGLLFYYRESTDELEQVSVGADGHLWVMTGPGDSNVRITPPTERPNGSTIQLRFTAYNLEPDRFESKMEITRDGGETWTPGNHQVLVRRTTL